MARTIFYIVLLSLLVCGCHDCDKLAFKWQPYHSDEYQYVWKEQTQDCLDGGAVMKWQQAGEDEFSADVLDGRFSDGAYQYTRIGVFHTEADAKKAVAKWVKENRGSTCRMPKIRE